MKAIKLIITALLPIITVVLIISSCSTPKSVAQKSGAQLWGENCVRCHNTPSPASFSDLEWEVAVMHMRIRAQLTDVEAQKIADFLKSAN